MSTSRETWQNPSPWNSPQLRTPDTVRTLNDPVDDDEPRGDSEWTPQIGMRRAIIRGALVAALLVIATGLLAWFLPTLVLYTLLRTFLALAIVWLLFTVVQDAAGFVGGPISAIAIALTFAVLLSHHIIFAIHGVPTRMGMMIGEFWFHPLTLAAVNAAPACAVVAATAICHRGVPGAGVLLDILMWRVRG